MFGGATAEDTTDEALAAFGLVRDGPPPAEAQAPRVWRCNAKTVRLFMGLRTQWRVGMAGPTALDYGVLPAVAGALRIKLTRRRFAELQTMESAALAAMAERRQ